MKLFDCHCHVHLGPRGVAPLFDSLAQSSASPPTPHPTSNAAAAPWRHEAAFAGAAVMSTHPRDYPAVDAAVSELRARSHRAVPCYGVHPWFLHEVLDAGERGTDAELDEGDGAWLAELRQRLVDRPDAIVGEIGLDGARWREVDEGHDAASVQPHYDGDGRRKLVLACPMPLQRRAFERQLALAVELQRPVSIHVVRAWGDLLASFDAVRERTRGARATEAPGPERAASSGRTSTPRRKKPHTGSLPPKIYFHAFSGKAGIISSLLAACEKGNVARENVYFGFAPAIPNYYSPKTPAIMRQIGLDQLVLETDLEDAAQAWPDLQRGVDGLAAALDLGAGEVAARTHANAERLYFGRGA